MLNYIEHNLLSLCTNGWEPIHAMYGDHKREGVTFDALVKALVKLFKLNYLECYVEENVNRHIDALTEGELMEHYGGDLKDDEIRIYPNTTVHYFKATKLGEEEEGKEVYDKYYPDNK